MAVKTGVPVNRENLSVTNPQDSRQRARHHLGLSAEDLRCTERSQQSTCCSLPRAVHAPELSNHAQSASLFREDTDVYLTEPAPNKMAGHGKAPRPGAVAEDGVPGRGFGGIR